MTKHLVRNFFGLLVLYIIIIFGIFAIQFRTELAIFENFLNFELRLSENAVEADTTELQLTNTFNVIGNGFNIHCEENNPVLLKTAESDYAPLILQTWEKRSPTEFSLNFSNDVNLIFNATETNLSIFLDSPNKSDSVMIPYETEKAYTHVDILNNKAIIQADENMYSLAAESVSHNALVLSTSNQYIATVAPYEKAIGFNYSNVIGLENSTQAELDELVDGTRSSVIIAFETASEPIVNEAFVAAYIAEQALIGNYESAIENVSSSFIDGESRTYFTSPYFKEFAKMYETLLDEDKSFESKINSSISQQDLNVYSIDNFSDYLQRQPEEKILDILSLPVSMANFAPSVYDAIGILDVYCSLSNSRKDLAKFLEPILEQCIIAVETSCVLQDSTLSLVIDDVVAQKDFTAKAGYVLQQYGIIKNRKDVKSVGIILLISAMQNIKTTDFVELYAYYVPDNDFYPHGKVIGYNNGLPIWVWGIVPEISVTDSDDVLSFTLEFPVGEIYHSIITGITPFESVQIRSINNYPSDPQFESYIAPGYVYDKSSNTLLLRYAQKSKTEIFNVFYKDKKSEY